MGRGSNVPAHADEWQDLDLAFCRPDGLPWHPDSVTSAVRKLVEASDLPRIRPLQDLRHTHATLLLVGGEHLEVIQGVAWAPLAPFTSDTYQHVTLAWTARLPFASTAWFFGDHRANDHKAAGDSPEASGND